MIPGWLPLLPSFSLKGSSPDIVTVGSSNRECPKSVSPVYEESFALCTCSCLTPHLSFPSYKRLLLGPPYIRKECNSLWDIVAAWTFEVSSPRPRKTI